MRSARLQMPMLAVLVALAASLLGAAGAASASTSASPSPSPSPSASATACPPPPPGSKGRTDRGFPRVEPVVGTQDGLPVVPQPFTLQLICYDPEPQQAQVSFTASTPDGGSVPVAILQGSATLTFTGHQDPNVVDASQTYVLNLAALGTAPATGWRITVDVVITNDRSASRTLPFVIRPALSPSPSVSPTPSASPTPSPSLSPTPSVSPTPTLSASPGSSPSVLPTHLSRHRHHAVRVLPFHVVRRPQLPFTGSAGLAALATVGAACLLLGAWLTFRRPPSRARHARR